MVQPQEQPRPEFEEPLEPIDYIAAQKKWQSRWYSEKLFEPRVDKVKKKFFFTVPYPYVSGIFHQGHGRTYSIGDVIARYKRASGYNLLWPMAFHITGTPVVSISSRISRGDADAIALYKEYIGIYEKDPAKIEEVVKSFTDPWNVVNFFAPRQIQDFCAIGSSIDLSRQFTTGDKEYNAFIQWQFKKYKAKNYLKQASYPLLYCANCRNAAGEDDIQDADTSPVEVMSFVAFKFSLADSPNEYVVSCTLRPETVFGITNMFANPRATYVKANVDGEAWWVSKEAAEKLKLQNRKVEVLEEKQGDKFIGKTLVDPLGRKVPILPGSFVDPRNASGFVHSVPAHAPYDLVGIEDLRKDSATLEKYGIREAVEAIKPIGIISLEGHGEVPSQDVVKKLGIKSLADKEKLEKATSELYKAEFYNGRMKENCGEYKGMTVTEAKERVTELLQTKGNASVFYETNRPAKCRCGGDVTIAVLADQWFLDFNERGWKERSYECLERMLVVPAGYRKLFEDIFAWLDKRPCARRRGLGTQLPFANEWIIESLSDSTIYMAFYTVIKAIREHGIKPEQLTEEFFDWVLLGEGRRGEVSRKTGIGEEVLSKVRDEFEYWYPNDLRHTATAHVSNHLSFFIFAHTANFDPRHWPKAITMNEVAVSEGTKVSKSKGNVLLLKEISEKYGADLFRMYSVGSADLGSVLDFRLRDMLAMKSSLNKFVSQALELISLKKALAEGRVQAKESFATRWMVSRFEGALERATEALEEFRLRDYVQIAVYGLMRDFEHFMKRAASDGERAFVAGGLLDRWLVLAMPLVPHSCEELWEKSGNKPYASLAKWPGARDVLIDEDAEQSEEFLRQVTEDIQAIKKIVKIAPKAVKIITSKKEKREAIADALLRAEQVRDLGRFLRDESLRKYVEKRFFELKDRGIPEFDESEVLEQAKAFVEKEVGLAVTIEREGESREEKASKAMPLKPAIILS
jgi:leucyl-tRNA synthetase